MVILLPLTGREDAIVEEDARDGRRAELGLLLVLLCGAGRYVSHIASERLHMSLARSLCGSVESQAPRGNAQLVGLYVSQVADALSSVHTEGHRQPGSC